MAIFSPAGGVSEQEPTLIADTELQDTDGAEYRAGRTGLFVARGRQRLGTISGVTGLGLYVAGFDESAGYLIAHAGNSLHAALIRSDSVSFSLADTLPTGSSAVVGTHYANRHYLVTGVANRRIERTTTGVTSYPIGMSASTFAVGVSTSATSGSMSATIGLQYWVTDYDSNRGIESLHGATATTGAFSGITGVVVTVTGVSANPRADRLRWYRSVDGGGYPDGGLIRETPIGTTQITDTDTATGSLRVPLYGLVSIGGIDTDRDAPPPVLTTIFGPFQDSLLGVAASDPRTLLFTPAGFPDSWPAGYAIPLETHRRDEIVAGVVLPARIGLFTKDSVHVIFRLSRDSDSIFAAGEAADILTDARGCVSRRGATVCTPPGSGALAVWVARDGIWSSSLASSPVPLTDKANWASRVSVSNLDTCRLTDDPINRRLVFCYRRVTDTSNNTGIWYLDYQEFSSTGFRITFADHGPLVDMTSGVAADGSLRLFSLDSRSGNGQVYVEANQDVDDSNFRDSSGSVRFRMRTKEFLPGGARAVVSLDRATWMHDAGPARIEHRFYMNRRDLNPEIKLLPDSTTRNASDVVLGRNINSFSLEIESTGTLSYGVHWIDVEGLDLAALAGRKGA